MSWCEDSVLKENLLDFLKRDYAQYAWSIRTLDRRLRYFQIYYHDRAVTTDQLRAAVKLELEGPGKLLGYRAMQKKIRVCHNLLVTRDAVYDTMYDVDPTGLELRDVVGAKRKKKKENFTSEGPNWVHSLDGHDKLMGYQNSTFPLAVYGCIDTASRKILWLRVWVSNSDPRLVGLWYLENLLQTRISPCMIRLDKGTETGIAATIHAFLQRDGTDGTDPVDTVLYGPSTSNQIERWWKELHERLEKYYKHHLAVLKDHGHYDPHDEVDRQLLAYLMISLLQKEVDAFKDTIWNSHRIRAQKDTVLPDGISVTEEQLHEAAILSDVMTVDQDFLDPDFRQECE